MRHHQFPLTPSSKQSGVVLFVALILLLILSLLGVTAARMQTVEERMARNDSNRQLGAQAAEAALRAAETGLLNGLYSFTAGNPGLLSPDLTQGSPLTGMDWSVAANSFSYPGPALTNLPTPSRTPKVVIENLNPVAGAGQNIAVVGLNGPPPVTVYRVTAQGVGADGTSTTTLQTIVR
jgi:type IV pilus assembly protein PilX